MLQSCVYSAKFRGAAKGDDSIITSRRGWAVWNGNPRSMGDGTRSMCVLCWMGCSAWNEWAGLMEEMGDGDGDGDAKNRSCSFLAVLFAGAGAVSPTRGRIEVVLAVTRTRQAANLGPRLGFQAKQSELAPAPGCLSRVQCPHRTGGSWLAEPASPPPMISPVPCQRGQEPPQGGEEKLGVEKQR